MRFKKAAYKICDYDAISRENLLKEFPQCANEAPDISDASQKAYYDKGYKMILKPIKNEETGKDEYWLFVTENKEIRERNKIILSKLKEKISNQQNYHRYELS